MADPRLPLYLNMQKLLSVKWGPAESELQHENGILSTNMMEQEQEHWHGHSNSINILVAVKAIKIGPVLIDSRGRGTSFCCFFFTNWSYTVLAGYTSYAPAQQTILLNLNCAIMILHSFLFLTEIADLFLCFNNVYRPGPFGIKHSMASYFRQPHSFWVRLLSV